jgi:hypothetical protein
LILGRFLMLFYRLNAPPAEIEERVEEEVAY